jgi:GntR family transcriptional regulator/MocR family aminotransferase
MLPFSSLITIDKNSKTPIFIQIAHTLSEQIRKGTIPVGAQLPGSRALAGVLNVHRQTVVAAYEELLAQGWLETQSAKGTFVSQKLPEAKPQGILKSPAHNPLVQAGFPLHIDETLKKPIIRGSNSLAFDDGFPDVRLVPWDALSRAYRSVLRQGYRKNLFFYGDTCGELSLRVQMAHYLRETRGLPIGVDNVLITRGSTMAIHLAAQLVLKPGDQVVVGTLAYGSANLIFQRSGAKLLPVPVDEQGMDVQAIERLCREHTLRMVYVTPHHHYPTAVSMPAERRLRLLQLAQQYGFCILEDDYDYDFHYEGNPILPLAGADTAGQVIYVGSLCKAMSPALRVGYVAAPSEVIENMAMLRRIVDRQGDNLLEAALAILFRDGEMRRHLKKAQKTYQTRRDRFCALLQQELGSHVEFKKPTGGMAVWAQFDPSIPLSVLRQKLLQKGMYIPDARNYSTHLNATRLGFASANEEEMLRGMELLSTLSRG